MTTRRDPILAGAKPAAAPLADLYTNEFVS
jgi:hypothetical protein